MRGYIDVVLLMESGLPNMPHLTRQFDMMQVGNRRFMFNPRDQRFVLGHALGAGGGKSIRSSHAEEYHDVHKTNVGYDAQIRGWVGTSREYPHGVIHFAPPISDHTLDACYTCLEAFVKRCGATDQTLVRGGPGAWEQPLGAILKP